MRMPRLIGVCALLCLMGGGALWWRAAGPEPVGGAYTAPGLPAMTAAMATAEAWQLVPALLTTIYDAFEETEEGATYDQLALAADGAALEDLYLQRAGELAGGGLTGGADQEVHELRLTGLEARTEGDRIDATATWEVIGTVGHGEHIHQRGNAYTAQFAIEPRDGAWRVVGFTLRDVDRTAAGTFIAAAEDDAETRLP